MESLNIYFAGPQQVEIRRELVSEPGPGEILVAARRSLISTGTELNCYARTFSPGSHWDQWVQYPFSPGYSHVGVVAAVGAGVDSLAPGDRVATRSNHRQFVTCAAAGALRIPDGVADEDAAWFGLASIVQNGVRRAEHELGEVVVVIGLGLLGQLVTQYVRLSGAAEVIAVDLSADRLAMAAGHGATRTLCMPVEEARKEVERVTDGRLADCVYDVTGYAPVFAQALGLARTLGKVVLLGDTGYPEQQHLTSDMIRRGLRVVAAHDGHPPRVATDQAPWTHVNMQKLFFRYVERGQMRVSDMVTARYSPADAAEAYASLFRDRSHAMGAIFDWDVVSGGR